MKVLVTGGVGFLGKAVVQELRQRGHDPVIFDRNQGDSKKSPWLEFASGGGGFTTYRTTEWILGDVRDATAITDAISHVDACIHLAGILGTTETILNPRPAVETNILGGLNVLEACAQYKTPLVNIAVGNWQEYSTYSISKTTVERFTIMYARFRDLPACSVRAFNVYGPGQSVAQPYGTSRVRKIIPSFIARALHGEPIQVYGDGSQVMDMIYITDAAKCLVTALEDGLAYGKAFTYEAGTGRRTTVKQIAELTAAEVERETGNAVSVEYLPMRSGETPGSEVLADPDVACLLRHPDDLVKLEDGLHETVAHYRKLFGK
jgi:UDP-glucose 4-epimerase